MDSWEAKQLERLKKDYEKQESELKAKLAKKKAKLDAATRRLRARAAATERKQDTRPHDDSIRVSMGSSIATGTGHCSTFHPGARLMTDSATSWIENEDRGCREARVVRLEWLAKTHPPNRYGFMLFGGWVSQQLLEEARYCFTYGQYLASAVLGVAFVERILAAKFYAGGRDDLKRAGGQTLLQEAR